HAFLWQNGIMTDLGTLGGDFSFAQAINNYGQIVGATQTASGAYHDFVWESGVMYDLDALLPANSGWVTKLDTIDINDNGQIVGYSVYDSTANFHAVIWQNGKINDLNKQLPRGSAWVLISAYDINGAGKIVGSGNIGGQSHAFLMVPGAALQAVAGGTTAGT